jgi:acetoin utilization deacetylase AcuC-like enzyme
VKTRLYSHEACLQHRNPPGHPERPERLQAIAQALSGEAFAGLERIEAPAADTELFMLAHPRAHVEALRAAIPETGLHRIDADTAASPQSWEAVRRAVGAAVDAVDAVMTGAADNAFVATRPPGHHAERTLAMGFCLINNIAVAARHAQESGRAERVAIVDFDVHHGNGTQDIFWDDPTVLYASTHQMPLYPGSGALNETGAGNIFNAPLRAGDSGEKIRAAFRERILPAIENFSPDLILVSAGFDAHWRDPLANLQMTGEDFSWLTGKLMEEANRHCGGKLVSLLEGGYDLEALAESASAHVRRLMTG